MTCKPKMITAAALVATAALVISGCPTSERKSAPAGTTEGAVVDEETTPAEAESDQPSEP